MWSNLTRIILRNRIVFLSVLAGITAFMGYHASHVQMSYEYARLLPESDSVFINYKEFKKVFGEEGNIIVAGVEDANFYQLEKFNDWYELCENLKKVNGVKGLASVTHNLNLQKNKELKVFEAKEIVAGKLSSQEDVDSIKNILFSLPFYKGIIISNDSLVNLITITVDKEVLNSKARDVLISDIQELFDKFSEKHNLEIRISGLPYVRTAVSQMVKKELYMFIALAFIVMIIILFLFFRSFSAVSISMLVVAIGVVWALGTISLFGYEITILSGLIPTLLIVIGIPNSVFLLNKYQQEIKKHGNQARALQRSIKKTGNAIFLTNLTTASGFATFIITQSDILKQFGIVASLNIMGIFVLALLLIPIIYSYLAPPKEKHTKHLDSKFFNIVIDKFIYLISTNRRWVYTVTVAVFVVGLYGLSLLESTGYIVDDIPESEKVYRDLKFFEKHFGGVMPLEIAIDTKKNKGAFNLKNIKKVEQLQENLAKYSDMSRAISFCELVKFSKQSFYGGNPKYYSIPNNQEKNFIMSYLSKDTENSNALSSFLDSSKQIMRVSVQMADVGTEKMKEYNEIIRAEVDSVFPSSEFKTLITGTSIMFFKGTTYLITNLIVSLALAIFLIAVFMSLMFRSFRMVVVSLIPNLIPLILTGALMGYAGIPIKPSTILVFSIAFGISVDDTIHYLAKYRQELVATNWDIGLSVVRALKETGISMIYTSIILFFGFGIFVASSFGGTAALGMLVSFTLLVAMLSNLILLPSFLLTIERKQTMKSLEKEPLIQIFDEEEDIDLDELKIQEEIVESHV